MARKTILRMESLPGHGIYCWSAAQDGEVSTKINIFREIMMSRYGCLANDRHPPPHHDSILHRKIPKNLQDYFFGFKDFAQFRAWFNDGTILYQLGEQGFTIACYAVSERIDGKAQSCAPIREKHPENELLRISAHNWQDLTNGKISLE